MYENKTPKEASILLSRFESWLEENKRTAPALDCGIASYKIDKLREKLGMRKHDPFSGGLA